MAEAEYVMRRLAQKGFSIGTALEICADDTGLYMEVLETALEEGRRKYVIITESLAEEDYERYHVEVHALKNSARAIGAMELSELALEQEKAAKRQDYEAIGNGSSGLLAVYREVLEVLEELLD